jgi:hypothetical protein
MSSTLAEAFDNASKKSNKIQTQVLQVKKYRKSSANININTGKRIQTLKELTHQVIVEIDHNFNLFQKMKPYLKYTGAGATNKEYDDIIFALQMYFVGNIGENKRNLKKLLGMPV